MVLFLGLLCGASAGRREGPTVQVGAAIMAAFGRLTPDRLPGLLLAGGAAGVAAAFNTPLAGIVFGIEELGRAYEARSSGLIVAGIVVPASPPSGCSATTPIFGTSQAELPLAAVDRAAARRPGRLRRRGVQPPGDPVRPGPAGGAGPA